MDVISFLFKSIAACLKKKNKKPFLTLPTPWSLLPPFSVFLHISLSWSSSATVKMLVTNTIMNNDVLGSNHILGMVFFFACGTCLLSQMFCSNIFAGSAINTSSELTWFKLPARCKTLVPSTSFLSFSVPAIFL